MSFRDKMHPIVPHAEEDIRVELSRRGVRVEWSRPLVLDQTIVDFLLPKQYPTKPIPVFIDGPPHLQPRVAHRDDYVNFRLDLLGYKPLRFPYTVPLSSRRLKEICDAIEEASKTEKLSLNTCP